MAIRVTNREKHFWNKVSIKSSHECWIWNAGKGGDSYGHYRIDEQIHQAHRIAWELSRRCRVPNGKLILHLCDNRPCCNPSHLYCGTYLDNMRDRFRGR